MAVLFEPSRSCTVSDSLLPGFPWEPPKEVCLTRAAWLCPVAQRKRVSVMGRESLQLPSVSMSCELAGIVTGLFWLREGGAWEMCLE